MHFINDYDLGSLIHDYFILLYIKNGRPNDFRNLSDLHLLLILFMQTTYVIMTSEKSGELFVLKIACALVHKSPWGLIS